LPLSRPTVTVAPRSSTRVGGQRLSMERSSRRDAAPAAGTADGCGSRQGEGAEAYGVAAAVLTGGATAVELAGARPAVETP
jgi:hypothetical protein